MRTREELRSAMAPTIGASSATTRLARPLASPRRNVLSVAGTPAFQNCLKNTGKKPAMTVQAKAELAQSYSAHANTGRRRSVAHFTPRPPVAGRCGARTRSGSLCEVFARFAEREIRPALECQLQVDAGRGQVHQRTRVVEREVVVGLVAELLQLLRVGTVDPARGVDV